MPRERAVLAIVRELTFQLYVPVLFSAIARSAAMILLPLYAFHISETVVLGTALASAVVGLRAAGTMIADVPAGLLVARIGDKRVMLVGLGLLVLAAIWAGFSSSAYQLVIAALAFGAGGGTLILARISYVTDTTRIEQRGRVVSIMAGIQRAGGMIGPIGAGFGVEFYGYETVFYALGLIFLISLVLVFIFTKSTPIRASVRTPIRLHHVVIRHVGTFVKAGSVMVMLSFLRNGRSLIVPVWGVAIGLGESEIGIAVSIAAVVDWLMFLPAGFILDHVGRKAALIPCLTFLGLCYLLLPLSDSFWTFVAVTMIGALGNGFGTGIFMTLGGDFSPIHGRSQFLGVWRFVGDTGGTIGPFAIGGVAAALTTATACVLTSGLAVVAIVVLWLFVPEPIERKSRR